MLLTQCVSVSANAIKRENAVKMPSSRMLGRNSDKRKQNYKIIAAIKQCTNPFD